jgi:hypothetical protein
MVSIDYMHDRLQAVELYRPETRADTVRFRGIDVFSLPARPLRDAYHGVRDCFPIACPTQPPNPANVNRLTAGSCITRIRACQIQPTIGIRDATVRHQITSTSDGYGVVEFPKSM